MTGPKVSAMVPGDAWAAAEFVTPVEGYSVCKKGMQR